jgi:hypothetical protein
MPLSIYQASVPVYVQYLGGLSGVLEKAAVHCAAHKIDESVLLQMRVYPDMFPMARQVGIALHFSAEPIARLAGLEVPDFGTSAARFADLKARIVKALEFIQGVKPEQLEGSESCQLELTQSSRSLKITGQVYLFHYALPQFCFHLTTAYDILRHAGVEIGKRDFLGEAPE